MTENNLMTAQNDVHGLFFFAFLRRIITSQIWNVKMTLNNILYSLLLRMIALSAVQSSAHIYIHDTIVFIDVMLGSHV